MSTIEAEQTRRRIHKQRGWWRWIRRKGGIITFGYAAVSDSTGFLLKGGSE